ncbi:MAG TPA: peptide deformylase [Syntrophomonadaceae bacterium]|nr:peptide deformylase [Syntrophomonadaceae bacterium]HNX29006.1 peptide deformylase [Syntrophomonadaceae bacterium]HPR93762.1 peptide deformylase [Syntrophomonadaceae bacterium]
MAVYQIVTEPDPTLRTQSKPVKNFNDGVLRVLDNMRETLYAFDGVGLAAIQIGVPKRMIVVDPGDNYIELINPVILSREGEKKASEGCLSVPGKVGLVNRAQKVTVKALNRAGEEFTVEAEDLFARVLQHEIDHLEGILFIDKATHLSVEK